MLVLASDVAKAALGVLAWIGVGALALVAVEFWDSFWGALPVLAAVVVAWYIGERMVPATDEATEEPR